MVLPASVRASYTVLFNKTFFSAFPSAEGCEIRPTNIIDLIRG